MIRRLLRPAAVLGAAFALLAAPGRAAADVQILIQELDSGGAVIGGTTQLSTGSVAAYNSPTFSSVSINVLPVFGAGSSLTTTVLGAIGTGFDPTRQLRVVVTADGFTAPPANVGGTADVTNNASASSGVFNGQNILSSTTQLLAVPLSPSAGQAVSPAAGAPLGLATPVATDIRPGGGISPTTTTSADNFPLSYAIQQTITVRVNPTGGTLAGSLGGSASSTVVTTPIPAPAGLILGLMVLPAIGARRLFRKSQPAQN